MDPLGTLLPVIAATGILGLLGIALLERLVPILPSAAFLVAMGVAAAEGHLSFSMALWSSTAGSLLGSLSFYGLGLALGEMRSFSVLRRTAGLLGIPEAQLGRWVISFRRRQRLLIFASQLIPSVRLLAPGIAGLLRADFREFVGATALGVALWNSLFLSVGYGAAILDEEASASALAIKLVAALVAGEVLALAIWRSFAWSRGTVPGSAMRMNRHGGKEPSLAYVKFSRRG